MRSGQYTAPNSRIAYASQDALIIPGTVRDNITFGLEFHEQRYQEVLAACALIPDLAKMKSSDQTMLGEKGSTLSGGQKQRIVCITSIPLPVYRLNRPNSLQALARAVYANAPWTLLDDPLSALDAETEAHSERKLGSFEDVSSSHMYSIRIALWKRGSSSTQICHFGYSQWYFLSATPNNNTF